MGDNWTSIEDEELALIDAVIENACATAAIDDHYVTPGYVSRLEFRVRYGYHCRRRPCVYCQGIHSVGMGHPQWCRNDSPALSGTRYRVQRADGSIVIDALSAVAAWQAAHALEKDRLAPILVARDAIAEGRVAEALMIADQLSPDLAVPLRREIKASIPLEDA